MPNKKLLFASKPLPANADNWVSGQTPATKEVSQTPLPPTTPAKTGIIKRLTLDLNEDLHRRIKLACTIRGSTMVEEITKLLEKEFPAS
jgi:ParG